MATIRERKHEDKKNEKGKTVYCVQVRKTGYPSRTATFPTERLAIRWATTIEAEMIEGRHFKNVDSRRRTFGDAAERYLLDEIPKKRSDAGMHKAALKFWCSAIGDYKLSDITAELIVKQRDLLARTPFRRANAAAKRTSLKKGQKAREFIRSADTVNRYTAVLRHVFSVARREWRWLDQNPALQISELPKAPARTRSLSRVERTALLRETAKNPKLHTFVVMALSTACRAGELLNLRWSDVDLERGQLIFRRTKNGDARTAWLSGEALRLLGEMSAHRGHVFTNASTSSVPYEYLDPFKIALAAADVEDFRFHDLRHSAATELARLGASEQQLRAMGGWRSGIVSRYVHLAAKDSQALASRLNDKMFLPKP